MLSTSPVFSAAALVAFYAILFGLHFALGARRSEKILSFPLFAANLAGLVAWGLFFGTGPWPMLWGFGLLGLLFFGYTNALAFFKRGITFSLLQNYAAPAAERFRDEDFINLPMRVEEMKNHGWCEASGEALTLTEKGRRVLKLYRAILRALRIEVIG